MKSLEPQFQIQEDLFDYLDAPATDGPALPLEADVDVHSYDRIVVFFSGGKDSLACALHLLELGVPPERIELHHHLIDGREGSTLMDWPITEGYCEAFAKAFGLRLQFSWKQGGFEREMLRDNEPTAPTIVPVDNEDGTTTMVEIGGQGPRNTRRMFPQQAASLTTRWCSSYLKIGAGAAYISNNAKFLRGRTLVVTGERAEESASRAKYQAFEPHRTDNRNGARAKRHVDHWRPVHKWTETQVWAIIERFKVAPHPAYILGWGRVSCMTCIFGNAHQWASVKVVSPAKMDRIANYEREFKVTIHRKLPVDALASQGQPYEMDDEMKALAMATVYDRDIIMDQWTLPAGAYGDSCGPT